jgi:protein-S-isoprenylcysteine O-methyltransferase Ste14
MDQPLPNQPAENPRFYVFAAVQALCASALFWLAFLRADVWDWQRYLGAVFTLIGMAGIAIARIQLGRSFAVRAEARKLVTHGLYSKIRNPIYVFGSALVAGIILVLHRPILWLFFLFMIVMQTIRAHREAQVLEAAFGDDYRDYRRKTWF